MFKRQINLDRRDLRLIYLNSHYTLIQKSLYKDDYREPVFEYRARIFNIFKEPRNQFQGIDSDSLCSHGGRYNNPAPIRFQVPIHCSKISAQGTTR